jgi:hypothetical protein
LLLDNEALDITERAGDARAIRGRRTRRRKSKTTKR